MEAHEQLNRSNYGLHLLVKSQTTATIGQIHLEEQKHILHCMNCRIRQANEWEVTWKRERWGIAAFGVMHHETRPSLRLPYKPHGKTPPSSTAWKKSCQRPRAFPAHIFLSYVCNVRNNLFGRKDALKVWHKAQHFLRRFIMYEPGKRGSPAAERRFILLALISCVKHKQRPRFQNGASSYQAEQNNKHCTSKNTLIRTHLT